MSFIDATRSVERQRFFDGQRLFASDLQGIEAFNHEMRRLHNQSLHQPGIGNGFAVSGRKGDKEAGVEPGYAIDDLGREIVLTTSRTIQTPPVAGDAEGKPQRYVLTVRYPDDAELEEVELREGICDTRGAVRLREEPVFSWVPLNPDGSPAQDRAAIVSGRSLILAEIAVRGCRLDKDLSIAQRRNARPPTRPYIACGVQQPTVWEPWDPWEDGNLPDAGKLALPVRGTYRLAGGLQAPVDTRSGGFLTTPGYFGRIDGPRIIGIPAGDGEPRVVLDGLLSIVDPTATGFTAQVLVLAFEQDRVEPTPSGDVKDPRPPEPADLVTEWQVGWMGVEG
ncbi:hypothetical protein [Wenjunlia tyrosinilytica]|uniref:Uncharacterized protein n=1 Tax=Wenjunlia tyrosinilytica TaxID=1544741 RepID=A0A917ZVT1_9ACTN|nr:hypothetical protein [Wenjunlia tyrosinilytica]GGO94447.1 hypothetical protein GCM10012280_49320 [Wenjunlia tyrosinilytica]